MDTCTAIVGINWGDEGKGRMVDLLTEDFDIVVRYQGGGNAGHTIINRYGEFVLHLLPSGVFCKGVVNVLGNGVALDPEHLMAEINTLREKGVEITPDNVMISERASLLMPWHRRLDTLEKARLNDDRKIDTTRKGIGPFYSDKYQKKTVLAGELFYPDILKRHLNDLREWKNLVLTGVYGDAPKSEEEIDAWIRTYCEPLKPFIRNTGDYLTDAMRNHKRILLEGQLGALRDLDYGIYPYTTSSNVLSCYGPIGAGIPHAKVERTIGVVKAYSSCIGDGPFVCELFGEEAEYLRRIGGEYGRRPHRIGPIDLVATRYGVKIQNATEIALTKLDVLSQMDEIPLCVRYRLDGKETDRMPFPSLLDRCEPVIETMKGWKCDISGARKWWDLPREAQEYVQRIEHSIGAIIKWISVGPERNSIILRDLD